MSTFLNFSFVASGRHLAKEPVASYYWLPSSIQNISYIFSTRIEIIHERHSLYNVLILFSLNLVITVSVIRCRMQNFHSGRESERPYCCVHDKATLFYKITVNALLESKNNSPMSCFMVILTWLGIIFV